MGPKARREEVGEAVPAGVTIRPADAGDVDALVELWCALGDAGTAADGRYRLAPDARTSAGAMIRERWLGPDRSPTAWVAVEPSGAVVGYVAIRVAEPHAAIDEPPILVITDAFVTEPHRRRGIGRALVVAALDHARREGVDAVDVGTLAVDARAVAFWRGLGFGDWRVTLRYQL